MHTIFQRVPLFKSGRPFDTAVMIYDDSTITVTIGDTKIFREGVIPFFTLAEVRKELEKQQLFLAINGSRIDVYPSGMSSPGFNAYIHIMQMPARLDQLVHIFKETDKTDMLGTVEAQQRFHEKWIQLL